MTEMLSPRFQHLAEIERRRISMPPGMGYLRFNRLEKPDPWPEWLLDDIRQNLPLDQIQRYPDYPPFYERLAKHLDVPADRLVVGAGIEEFARSLFMICGDPGDSIVVHPWPSCAMFGIYARVFQLNLVRAALPVPDGFHDANLKLVWLVSPGQPVESLLSVEALREIATETRDIGCVLAIDEAYYGFGAPTALELVDEFDNVVVLRTFSKAYGCAGLRVGYAVAQEPLKRALDAVRQSGEVSSLSMWIATRLMDSPGYVEDSTRDVRRGRNILLAALHTCGLNAYGSHANYVAVHVPDAQRVARDLCMRDVWVRSFSPNEGAPHDWLLVTCGTIGGAGAFFSELRDLLGFDTPPLNEESP